MIISWNSSQYGPQNDNLLCTDVWGVIQEEVRNGWFVPSKSEWAAFGDIATKRMRLTTSNYSDYDLSDTYWTSSQGDTNKAYLTIIGGGGYIRSDTLEYNRAVRLSAIF